MFKSAFCFTVLSKIFSLKSNFLSVVRNDTLYLSYKRKLNILYDYKPLFDINIVVTSVSLSFMKTNRPLLKETMAGGIMVQKKQKTTCKI